MTIETTQPGVSQEQQLHAALAEGFYEDDPQAEQEQQPQADEVTEEVEQEPEAPENDEAEEGGDQESDDEDISTLDQLAEALEMDRGKILGLKTKIKVDGEEKEITLQDLLKVNQLEGHVNKKSIELSEQRKAFDAERTQQMREWQDRIGLVSSVLDQQESQLAQQYQQQPWDQLYNEDPGQYAALQARFQQAHQAILAQKQGIAQHYQQTQQQLVESLRPKAREAISAAYPELADESTYSNTLSEVKSYLKAIGANEQGMAALEYDPVVFRVARDAAAHYKATQSRAQVEKRVRSAPKNVKTSPKLQTNTKAKRAKELLNRIKQTGDTDDLGALFAMDLDN